MTDEKEAGTNIPKLDDSTSVDELLYLIGHAKFTIYKHEREREELYRKLYDLAQSVKILTSDNDKLLLESVKLKKKVKNARISSRRSRK